MLCLKLAFHTLESIPIPHMFNQKWDDQFDTVFSERVECVRYFCRKNSVTVNY